MSNLSELRGLIREHTHADEAACVERLLAQSQLGDSQRDHVVKVGRELVQGCRGDSDKAGTLDVFMQEFSLSSKEGVALMCLAESLLRVPDAETADDLIAEKILSGDWGEHSGKSDSLFVNASTWGLMLTGRVVSLESEITENTDNWLKKLVNRVSEPVVRTAVRQAMKIMGQQYVLGRDIEEAITRGRKENTPGTRFSFDMLGEGARTMKDAERYFHAYMEAIREIGKRENKSSVIGANGISVKFSALHPRYQYVQEARVMNEMVPRIRELALEAKKYGLGFSVDAEEADRLDISLDIFESLARDPELLGWDGLGFVLQAYGKRAPFVAEWLAELARDAGRKLMVRLVKGAYWDTEIKLAQEEGYKDFPVYTRKANTDLSYQVCAAKLLDAQDVIYPQFATHNAHTAALILELAEDKNFEFQRLHGMGDLLHMQLAKGIDGHPAPVRVYAPVGAHKDLLPYLVRRLLENGANSSFVNRFMDKQCPVEQVITDVQADVESSSDRRHSAIPLPVDIFRHAGEMRSDTHGIDLANADAANELLQVVECMSSESWATGPIIGGKENTSEGQKVVRPTDNRVVVGTCRKASAEEVSNALELAHNAQPAWDALGGEARAEILEKAADMMEARMAQLIGVIAYEAGRTLNDGVSEVREAVDFLRYYALQARNRFSTPEKVTGPLGEIAEHSLHGCGVFFCISPWNFPLAIFVGQVAAALASGNSVIAKPADPTPIIASEGIKILHEAGVPGDVLNFVPGRGSVLGPILNTDSRVKGVAFTGSTEVALDIQKTLVGRGGEVPVFIAETGGQNSMIVDSSSLPEQVVDDAIRSAFLSAGQRCSALRVMYVQDDIADGVIEMLKGAMKELTIGNPWQLATDVGPVIDDSARQGLLQHVENMKKEARLHYACDIPEGFENGTFMAPHLFELKTVNQLPGEIFGPILHVIRFDKADFSKVIDEINGTGFGLTLGVHSRIESFASDVVKMTRVGNNYINRNTVGAVVGVNPFGGQGLSGTGPKAGGPNYMTRFSSEKIEVIEPAGEEKAVQVGDTAAKANAIIGGEQVAQVGAEQVAAAMEMASNKYLGWDLARGDVRGLILDKAADLIAQRLPDQKAAASACRYYAQQARAKCQAPIMLPGPTGETNELTLHGRGVFFCAVADGTAVSSFVQQVAAALAAGNAVIAKPAAENALVAAEMVKAMLDAGVPNELLHFVPGSLVTKLVTADFRTAGIAWTGPVENALQMQLDMAERGGAIAPMVVEAGGPNYLVRFAVEKTTTVNIVATGGNALLLNLDEGIDEGGAA
ncbi:bifunctional proline dehydrogenase/L-glutamate gamma-semialdehyde dehydrogenase PutA [Porticoccus sp. W117]|uniref:bifunctional proline dehydrogenase/L-glutamate gamma-semialdehyde dehydrogenase PutA n=1 Tax=Porticoccus sp. W117 TaxID=3054777 RepID=UPI00259447DF|nr:bifunctional proline dehydrogenase/L-glutamate gamma-semialdehyde dehydrogenase PutA [Porticoccus sp. W117]MDM3872465.1 bifunctional proline dehydrogenase/L-glutamate gamma-semialdehyde dehydrogenase PutA [Porticoccus sp. W117]